MADISNSKLLEVNTGILPKDACIIIIRTEWNATIIDRLEEGCRRILQQEGLSQVITVTVPGAFEIPFAIKNYWETSKYWSNPPKAFIALGCVLRGDTPHFDYVCKAVTDGVLQLNQLITLPTHLGVLTVIYQQRAAGRMGDRRGH